MESLIGKNIKVNYGFPLDNEIFEIVGERKNQIEVQGDFSAGTHNVCQSEWIEKTMIKEFMPLEKCDFCDKPMTHKNVRTCDEHSINRRM